MSGSVRTAAAALQDCLFDTGDEAAAFYRANEFSRIEVPAASAPHERGVFPGDTEADRQDLESPLADLANQRLKLALNGEQVAFDAKHARYGEAPDICVHHPDGIAFFGQSESEVGGDRGLADTALA